MAQQQADLGALQHRLAALLTEAHPSFPESLALARELQNDRCAGCRQFCNRLRGSRNLLGAAAAARPAGAATHSWTRCCLLPLRRQQAPDKQLAACRALVRAMPTSLPAQATAQLVALASGWLAGGSGSSGEAGDAATVQLQAEATHLLLAMCNVARAKLPLQACRPLLQQVCRLCRQPQQAAAPAPSVAAGELACGCLELLAQLPQWYPQPSKAELAAAVAAGAAALEQQTMGSSRSSGGGSCGDGVAESPATTRLLCKLVKALQVLLAEVGAPPLITCMHALPAGTWMLWLACPASTHPLRVS